MASNFPSSLDSFTNPSSTDAMDSVSVPHATQHSDLNDAVEALQAKVGADSSGVASSHDYKIAQLEALGTVVAFTPSWTNFTPGNATESWHYVRVNDLLIVSGRTLLGSTSSVSSLPLMDFPVGSQVSPSATVAGRTIYEDSGGDLYLGFIDIDSSKFRFWVEKADATYVKREFVTSSVPMTWTTSDILWMTATVMIS